MGQFTFTVQSILVTLNIFCILGLIAIYITNKYLLKKGLHVFTAQKKGVIVDISIAFLLLSFTYFVYIIGQVTYFRWIPIEIDKSANLDTLIEIFSNWLYTFIMIGPFIWITETFGAVSRAFILNNLWELKPGKLWEWLSITSTALLFAFMQVDQGLPAMINVFLVIFASNVVYYKYRNVVPLIAAGIFVQTIDLVSFWLHNI